MENNKELKNDIEFDNYVEASDKFEEYYEENKKITTEEMKYLIRSFSNKEGFSEFLHTPEDAILLHLESSEDFDVFIDEVLNNKEGFTESLKVLSSAIYYHPQITNLLIQKLKERDDKVLRKAFIEVAIEEDYDFPDEIMKELLK